MLNLRFIRVILLAFYADSTSDIIALRKQET